MKKRLISIVLSAAVVFGLFLAKPTDVLALSDIFATVASGDSHTLAIKDDGSLWAWGFNRGCVGDGSLSPRNSPVKIMDNVTAVSAEFVSSAAIKTDGTLWTWGSNYCGQIGDGTYTDRTTPYKALDNAAAVSVGSSHTILTL